MIKQLFAVVITLFLAIGILTASINKASGVPQSLAAASLKGVSPTLVPTQTIAPQPTISYSMVYPGMLPDQPLYKIKMVRDRIWLILTTNHLKRAELMLLFSDKRVGAGKVLIEGGKVPLGISTIIKGEKYFERVIDEAEKAKGEGEDITSILDKMRNASLKHQEILTELLTQVNTEGKTTLEEQLKNIFSFQERLKSL